MLEVLIRVCTFGTNFIKYDYIFQINLYCNEKTTTMFLFFSLFVFGQKSNKVECDINRWQYSEL